MRPDQGKPVSHLKINRLKSFLESNEIEFHQKILNRLEEDCSGATRAIPLRIFPRGRNEVKIVLKHLDENEISFYPISMGKNYGFGAHLPVDDRSVLLDLSRINKISDFCPRSKTVRVEPGVSQEMLYRFLEEKHSEFRMDVTGSSIDSSVLGNLLEKGLAFRRPRRSSCLSLELLSLDGQILETGARSFGENYSKLGNFTTHIPGVELREIFLQSNFAVALSARIRLEKKPEQESLLVCDVKEEQLGEYSEAIAILLEEGLISALPRTANQVRRGAVFSSEASGPDAAWRSYFTIYGTKKIVSEKVKLVNEKLSECFSCFVYDSVDQLPDDQELKFVWNYYRGVPQNVALKNVCPDIKDDEKEVHGKVLRSGYAFFAYLLPVDRSMQKDFLNLISDIKKEFNFEAAVTLNLLDSHSMEAVVSFSFDKSSRESVRLLENIRQEIVSQIQKLGLLPYRLDIDSMKLYNRSDSCHKWIEGIKNIFDENRVISRGRYHSKDEDYENNQVKDRKEAA